MRLPQSSLQSLFARAIYFLAIGIAFVFIAVLPASARATIIQLASAPSSLRFGDVIVGQTQTLLATVTNNGQTSLTISAITANTSQFTVSNVSLPFTMLAGQSLEFNVSYTPTDTGWTSGTIKLSSTASNATLVIDLSANGVNTESLSVTPAAISFGEVATGSSVTTALVLTNAKTWKMTLAAATVTGNGFSLSGATFPLTLNAGQSVTLNVKFAPQFAGTDGGSIFISGPAQTVPLIGTGTAAGQFSISPALLNFGNVPEKTTETLPLILSASGASVTVSAASSSSSQFTLEGASLPFTVAAGQSVSFNVAFTPQSSGTISGSLSFSSNASNSQTTESLSGTGTVTPASVSLFWNSSSDAVGYNVYRSPVVNGAYSKINPALEANTAYTDNSVSSGQTYYYEATSVNSAGQESARSTPAVQATVP